MKKILLSALVFTGIYAHAQNVVFNDPALKQKIVAHDQAIVGGVSGPNISLIDTDLNGEISIVEAQAYTGRLYLNQNGSNFYTDLTGVEEFINVTELFCQNNQMTTLDVSSNVELIGLYCENNQISTLNLANNVDLEILNYRYNSITTINLAANTNLTDLTCTNNGISSIDLSANINLENIDISANSLTSLGLSNNTNLVSVDCSDNMITVLSFANQSNLLTFTANDNDLNALILPTVSVLLSARANSNNLTLVNFTDQTSLDYVELNDNQITVLDVSSSTVLDYISIKNNQLSTVDLTANSALTVLEADDNNISTCVMPSSTLALGIPNNSLTSLDLSTASGLVYLDCSNNDLTFLDVSNGNNTSMGLFSALSNSSLTCISVDDVAYSTTNWTDIDPTTSFSLNCPVLVNDITVSGQAGANTITTDGGTLQMMADVLPVDATDDTYTWSVTNGTGAATIDVAGLLTATNNGTVSVVATANDGSGITGSTTVTISNQTALSINSNDVALNMSMFPNPTTGIVNFETTSQIELIEVYNLIGEKVNVTTNTNTINIKELPNGIYVVKVTTSERVSVTKKLVKK